MTYIEREKYELELLNDIYDDAIFNYVIQPTNDNLNAMNEARDAYFDAYYRYYPEG